MIVALIACSKSKKRGRMPARELYSASALFRKAYAYAERHADKIVILSSKYGALKPDAMITEYEETLNGASNDTKKKWAIKTFGQLRLLIKDDDKLLLLCGLNYRRHLMTMLNNKMTCPIKGMGIGRQLEFFTKNVQ